MCWHLSPHKKTEIEIYKNLRVDLPNNLRGFSSRRIDEFYARCGNEILSTMKIFKETSQEALKITNEILDDSKYNITSNSKIKIGSDTKLKRELKILFSQMLRNSNLKVILTKSKEEFEYEKREEKMIHGK